MNNMNILITGVGGQGTVLASKVLGQYARLTGQDVKLSEIHGMSQRGGSVTTHVRMGDRIYSPVIWEGGADVILSFEILEAQRTRHYLRKGGTLLCNDQKILPMPCISGGVEYPATIKESLLEEINNAYFFPAEQYAEEAGSAKATNIVLIGSLTKLFNLDKEMMEEAILSCVPEKFKDLNIKAFELGYDKIG